MINYCEEVKDTNWVLSLIEFQTFDSSLGGSREASKSSDTQARLGFSLMSPNGLFNVNLRTAVMTTDASAGHLYLVQYYKSFKRECDFPLK